MLSDKTFIIIQARMGSERLPGKIMLPLCGKPLIGILIKRLQNAEIPIVLATPKNPENDSVCDYARTLGVNIFRGGENNVLERFYFAAEKHKASQIIRVTGDNPLIDGFFIRDSIQNVTGFDRNTYFSPRLSKTFPRGTSFELFSFALLKEAYEHARSESEREHVTPYMHQNFPGSIKHQTIRFSQDKSAYRLTVDTKEDYELVKLLVEKYHCHKKTLKEIIKVMDDNPELHKINQHVRQKEWKETRKT